MNKKLPQPLADEEIVQHLLETTRQGDTVGDFCIFGASSVEISPEELQQLLRQRGIARWTPVDIKPRVAMRKAISEFKPAMERDNLKLLVRKVVENEEEVRYALVGEKKGLARDLEYGTMNQVVLNKQTGELSFTGKEVPDIIRMYEYLCGVYTQRELLLMTRNVLKAFGGIQLKAHGSMWFMPASARDIVNSLRDLYNRDIESRYGTAYFRPLGILESEDARTIVGAALQQEIDADLDAAARSLRYILRDEHPKQASLQHAINRVKEVKGKVQIYRGLVQIDLEWIDAALTSAAQKLTEAAIHRQVRAVGWDHSENADTVFELAAV